MKNLEELEKNLGIFFKDKNLLLTALVHRSFLNEHPEYKGESNERLEFLGDAVLDFVVSEYLFKNFHLSEGEMTDIRSFFVKTPHLSETAKNLGIEKFLFLSKGEKKDKRGKKLILASALEAIIGAIFLDQGIKKTKAFIKKFILKDAKKIIKKGHFKDPKTLFQEFSQKEWKITPEYKVLREWGPEHEKEFEVGVFLGEKLLAKGHGFSKKEAEEEAAKNAIKEIKTKGLDTKKLKNKIKKSLKV